MKRKSRQSGFTLVELMIVVAIIGILSAIAVPNFRRYQARSRRAEAQMALGSVYSAQQSWFSEFSSFYACLNHIGFVLDGTNEQFYTVGSNNAASVLNIGALVPSLVGTAVATCTNGNNATWYAASRGADGGTATDETDFPAAPNVPIVNQSDFIIGAAGNISSNGGAATPDTWFINESKNLTNTIYGVL